MRAAVDNRRAIDGRWLAVWLAAAAAGAVAAEAGHLVALLILSAVALGGLQHTLP